MLCLKKRQRLFVLVILTIIHKQIILKRSKDLCGLKAHFTDVGVIDISLIFLNSALPYLYYSFPSRQFHILPTPIHNFLPLG